LSSPLETASARAARRLLAAAAVLVLAPAAATAASSGVKKPATPLALGPALEREIASARKATRQLGVSIVDLSSRAPAFAYQADSPLMLASNTKLLTTAAALGVLGSEHVFETRVYGRGSVADGRLAGDLAVVGGGDPNISGRFHDGDSLAIFRGWADALAARGIRRVEGDLLLVNGMFAGPRIHPDWPRDQLTSWYEAPVDALSFNDNCVLVRVRPGLRAGLPARVETVPPVGYFTIRSTATTSNTGQRGRLTIGRNLDDDTLLVSGTISLRSGPIDEWVAVHDPAAYFAAAVRAALAERGIEVAGATRHEHGPIDALVPADREVAPWELYASYQSDLARTLEVTNKRSQNFYAESLAKFLGWRGHGEGSWEAGLAVVSRFVAGLGVDPNAFRLADGSGLSRANTMTPRAMTALLGGMYFHPLGRDYVRSLPYSGEKGLRWQRRLARPPYAGNVFAKTGTIRGVSTLSGYAKAASGKVYAFSILCNEVRSTSAAMAAQDRIVSTLIDRG
jgi:D-alanyl-D-alanine carboxypeptidase/D-alanyl-D-alanine-endopeptidase (penicillin-binding protein 4)